MDLERVGPASHSGVLEKQIHFFTTLTSFHDFYHSLHAHLNLCILLPPIFINQSNGPSPLRS